MAGFESLSGISYMWKAIDRIHICFAQKPSEKQVLDDYFNCLKYHYVLLQGVYDYKQRFLNFCVKALSGY